jgi:hypothetical protein
MGGGPAEIDDDEDDALASGIATMTVGKERRC